MPLLNLASTRKRLLPEMVAAVHGMEVDLSRGAQRKKVASSGPCAVPQVADVRLLSELFRSVSIRILWYKMLPSYSVH